MADVLIIVHLLGVVLGMGGALASDLMFFSSVRDGVLHKTELRFMRLGSLMVWAGLGILLASGLGLFSGDPAGYLASSKFMLKMTIVAVIFLNGLLFHAYHIPRMRRAAGVPLRSSAEFMRWWPWLLASGAISFSSWMSAFLLGSLRSIPLTYGQGLLAYAAVLAAAITGAVILKERLLPPLREQV